MKNLRFSTTIVMAAALLISCGFNGETIRGNGKLSTEVRHPGNVSKIDLSGGMDVFVDEGSPSVKVKGDENILRYVETEVHNGWLEIRTKEHTNIHSSNHIKVYVTSPAISDLRVNGSGNITCDGKFSSGNNMSFNITGSGNITANVNTPAVSAEITGSGNMYLKGETRNADVHITGSGNYTSPSLKAENAAVEISGSGDASLFADNSLKASIAGSGDIKYRGNASVEKHIAGSGSVVNEP